MHARLFVLLCAVLFVQCTPHTAYVPKSESRSHAGPARSLHAEGEQPPDALPPDFKANSAPKPPPNHDGALGTDAGVTWSRAVPFQTGGREGRIGDNDTGDGWVLSGVGGDVLRVRIENQSTSHALRAHLLDANALPVAVPPPETLPPETQFEQILVLPGLHEPTRLLVIIEGDQPASYIVHIEQLPTRGASVTAR